MDKLGERSCLIEDEFFLKEITGQLWQMDALLLVDAILTGAIVGIGAYGHRYRHHGFTRYLFLGANALFVNIITYVLSATSSDNGQFYLSRARCFTSILHPYLVIVSTCLVLISAINTSPVVATDDREERSIGPPFGLLLQGIWTACLIVNTDLSTWIVHFDPPDQYPGLDSPSIPYARHALFALGYLRYTPFALIYAKMALKYYAFLKARRSFALGCNPRLIVGYMQQLLEGSQHGEPPRGEDLPPPLVVMGEDRRQVEKQPHGYVFSKNLEATDQEALVTIDRVWKLVDRLPMPMPQLKEICFSFALFKLLRCRFARFKLIGVISTETLNFFRSVLLKDGEHERAFRMIVDELSFLHDYYDSPLPMSYSDLLLPILSMVISLLTIGYCILSGIDIAVYTGLPDITSVSGIDTAVHTHLPYNSSDIALPRSTIICVFDCSFGQGNVALKGYGSLYFSLVPVLLLLVFVVIAEARDIASHICSDRAKVTFTCQCVHRDFLKLSPVVPKWVGCLLQCRPKFMRHWNDKMRQNSMLALRERKVQLVFPGRLLRLLYQGRNVKIPTEVKACIINVLRRTNNGGLSKGRTSLRQNQVGESLLWACDSKGTSDVILIWHIATCILEDRHPDQHDLHRGSSIADYKTTASHLSRYCAYLVACYPKLLPDDHAWSKSLYKAVKKDAVRVLAGGIAVSTPEDYEQMVDLLINGSKHDVLKKGAELGKQLVEMLERGEEMAWKVLADFWSEMILYVAPSDNIEGHAEAIDRGGELITLLWALLTHIGIVDRPDNTTTASTPSVV